MVEAAVANREVFWPTNLNGNPTDQAGNQLEIWKYDEAQLGSFIDQCESQKVSFVATEWGLPNVDLLAKDERVLLVTCLRDPLSRYVSNFYYDLHNGYTQARSLEQFNNTRQRLFTMDNYYCRILSRSAPSKLNLSEDDFITAQKNLKLFDCVAIAGSNLAVLSERCGWSKAIGHTNRHRNDLTGLIGLFLRLKWRLLFLRVRYRRSPPSEVFKRKFLDSNHWDYRLFELDAVSGN